MNTKSVVPDLSVDIAGVHFQNPLIAASGTFGYGIEYADVLDVNIFGGICSKGLTLKSRAGNTGVRIYESPCGLINSIGLENPGIAHFIEQKLPQMQKLRPVTIVNLSGFSIADYAESARLLDEAAKSNPAKKTAIPIIELNISCPNVKAGGMAFGLDPDTAAEVTAAVRATTDIPLMVKLSPNAPDLPAVAQAVRKAGASALSLVNTFQAAAIDIEKGKPVFENIRAGLSGPAIQPLALRMVYDICTAMSALPVHEQIPIVGLGGISTWQDAVQFIMAGSSAIQVGTAIFANPLCPAEILQGLADFMHRKGYSKLADFRGCALV